MVRRLPAAAGVERRPVEHDALLGVDGEHRRVPLAHRRVGEVETLGPAVIVTHTESQPRIGPRVSPQPYAAGVPSISRVDPDAALDSALVDSITGVMNAAYIAAEAGLWTKDVPRTNDEEMRGWIEAGEVVAASYDGRIVGAVRTHLLDDGAGWFGALSVAPEATGRGIARQLVSHIETDARARGVDEMQLEVLRAFAGHPHLDRLRAWYERLGYGEVGRQPAAELMPDDMPFVTRPLEVVVMRKQLT